MSNEVAFFKKMNNNVKLNIKKNTTIGENIVLGSNCKILEIGYGATLGDNIYIDVPELYIGEYTTIHKNVTLHGYKKLLIGHNCWIGQNTVIDSIGKVSIGNNVGIGSYSQLWSHIKFGDTLEGCRWNSEGELLIEDDVWFVGHCVVSPIHAKKKSMLLVGGVITTDMEENCIYGGSPAKNLTDKLGSQFVEKTMAEKVIGLKKLYIEFLRMNKIAKEDFSIFIVDNSIDRFDINSGQKITVFNIQDRTYIPTRSKWEHKFMRFLLYDKAKFTPVQTE